jgi:CheY-like chemotaxis protein
MGAATILLVDDNSNVREITALMLRDSGYNVIEAASGTEALSALSSNPAIELLIVDFAMPEMSGIEVLERARAKRPQIKATFITGYDDQRGLSEKFTGEVVVKKPFTMEQLAIAVRKSLCQSEE